MNETKRMTADERYIYNERLAQLSVLDRRPTQQEHQQALQDVQEYRHRVSELAAALG
jgi:hypothetical protein